jgi:hypothetical protein
VPANANEELEKWYEMMDKFQQRTGGEQNGGGGAGKENKRKHGETELKKKSHKKQK